MLDQLQDLAAGLAGTASPSRFAFLLAGILAMAGLALLWPRRRVAAVRAPSSQPAATAPPVVTQWGRLTGLIATGVSRTDSAGRAHDAAGNALNALEHDLDVLRRDLAGIEHPSAVPTTSAEPPSKPAETELAAAA